MVLDRTGRNLRLQFFALGQYLACTLSQGFADLAEFFLFPFGDKTFVFTLARFVTGARRQWDACLIQPLKQYFQEPHIF
jgi:hypothetical protein